MATGFAAKEYLITDGRSAELQDYFYHRLVMETIQHLSRSFVDCYIDGLKGTNKAENTIRRYKEICSKFEDWVFETFERDLLTCLREQILGKGVFENYRTFLSESEMSKQTIDSSMNTLRNFIEFLCSSSNIYSPVIEGTNLRSNRFDPSLCLSDLAADRLKRFISTCWKDPEEIGVRLVGLALHTGLTNSELQHIQISDIEYGNTRPKRLLVAGTRRLKRHIPLNRNAARLVHCQLGVDKHSSDWLFTSNRKSYLSAKTVDRYFKEVGSRAKLKDHLNPSKTRAHFIRSLAKRGVSVEVISELCGTSSLDYFKPILNEVHPSSLYSAVELLEDVDCGTL